MALITCPECGNTISDKAPLCPHCGILKEDIQAMLHIEFDKAKMQERIDNLVLKGAVVNIGAYSIFAQADIAKRIEEALDEE